MAKIVKATEAVRRFSEIMNRVKYQGQTFEVVRGGEVIARIVPPGPPRSIQVGDLPELFAQLPPLGEERKAFAKDLRAIRKKAPKPKSAWD